MSLLSLPQKAFGEASA
uniref:Uncharacterized protein n=1 Tax=Rhizophora mucronata TaxID=61149 RepID=A0A2P2JAW0_RHIMU